MINTIVYYSTSSGNVSRFVSMLEGFELIRIPKRASEEMPVVDKPFCLIVPTYKGGASLVDVDLDTVPKQVVKFLDNETNRKNAKVVSASGNVNFGEDFCIAGSQIEKAYGIPYRHRFEMSGTQRDADILMNGLKTMKDI